jgi:acyl-CoA thioesterase FadM
LNSFKIQLRVYYEDVDIGGVVYYAVEGIGFVVARAEIDFRIGARLDDLLEVSVKPIEKKKMAA